MAKNFKHRPLFSQNEPDTLRKPKIKSKILPILWAGVRSLALVLGFITLIQLLVVFGIILPAGMKADVPELPKDNIVLYWEFDKPLQEIYTPEGFASAFEEPSMTVREIINLLNNAADDTRVKGLVARMKSSQISMVHAEELRQALLHFKEAGKFAYVYSTSYGESAQGLGNYYLISTFDEIWMQPMGIVSLNGLNAEMPFMRGLLNKVGVTPNFFQRKDYKTAYENFTRSSMSDANEETYTRLIGDIREEILKVVPAQLGMEPEAFAALVDKGLFTTSEAEEAGLVTHVGYVDTMIGHVKKTVFGKPDGRDKIFVSLPRYAAAVKNKVSSDRPGFFSAFSDAFLKGFEEELEKQGVPVSEEQKEHKKREHVKHRNKKPSVALIYAVGAIVENSDSSGPPLGGGGGVIAADKLAPLIADVAEDKSIDAIVLRIDSPGGSPTASERILRSIERAQENGKPVIVSMGNVAASGGYWISAYADQIFVLPTTITGSIGVVGGKIAFEDLFDKLGVNWEHIRWGENAGMWSVNTPFSKSEAERINAMLDAVYDGFIERVARGRNMREDDVDKIAGGRVWSGKRAVEIGLADQIGGLNDTLDYTAELLGHNNRDDLRVRIMPKPKTAFEHFIALLEGQAVTSQVIGDAIQNNAWLTNALGEASVVMDQSQNPQNYMVYQPIRVE